MKGVVMAYRGSHKTQDPKRMIIKPEGVDNKEDAAKLVGKRIVWTSTKGNKIAGIITKAHGGKGAVLVKFSEKGLPGQALGTKVDIE